jgi:hypothetical protein
MAGVMNLVQMSRSLSDFLSIGVLTVMGPLEQRRLRRV